MNDHTALSYTGDISDSRSEDAPYFTDGLTNESGPVKQWVAFERDGIEWSLSYPPIQERRAELPIPIEVLVGVPFIVGMAFGAFIMWL